MTTTENPAVGQDIVANGIRTNYHEAGTAEETVVLIHGSGPGVTAYANWRLVIPALAENFHVLAPDMVGFGYSDRPADVKYGLDTWANQTIAFIEEKGIKKAHLIGNSFGGSIALRIATLRPDLVDRLVLMGSMGVYFPITEGLDNVWGYNGTIEDMRSVLDFFAYNRNLVNEELAQVRYRDSSQPGWQEGFSSMFPAPRQRWVEALMTPEEDIKALKNRTLIMHGREDKVIPLSTSLRLEELIDDADLCVFAHCGHWSMIERTADFNRLVRDFFLSGK
jgi:pimeloyl-ACP methyl ester carboxylesterase